MWKRYALSRNGFISLILIIIAGSHTASSVVTGSIMGILLKNRDKITDLIATDYLVYKK